MSRRTDTHIVMHIITLRGPGARRAAPSRVMATCFALLLAGVLYAQPRPFIGVGVSHARASIDPVAVGAGTAQLLVTLHVDPGWHVSWRNPGETGLPTRLGWTLPAGVSVARETWPVPVIAHTGVGATHTLEGDVPWLVDLDIDGRVTGAGAERLVSLTMRYGICREVCIPEQITVHGVLPARGSRMRAVPTALRARLASDGGVVRARLTNAGRTLCLAAPPLPRGAGQLEFVADSGTAIDAAVPFTAVRRSGVTMRLPAGARLVTGTSVLFVRGTAGVSARLDFTRAAPGCVATRRR